MMNVVNAANDGKIFDCSSSSIVRLEAYKDKRSSGRGYYHICNFQTVRRSLGLTTCYPSMIYTIDRMEK